ncbi:MAG: hypothetical protein JWO38_6024 [Gemmataceae bacterium]|nr:hypothetical protein [Gemmataceae bacterium]
MRASRWVMIALFVTSAVLVVEARQPRPGFGPGGGGITGQVLTNKALQEELKITDAQKEKFKDVADRQIELAKKRGEAFKSAGGDKEKLKEAFTDLQKEGEKLGEDIKKVTDDTLTADQKKRLKQIEVQASGVRAFQNEDVIVVLKLTDDQKSKIKGISEEFAKDAKEVFGGGGFKKGGFDPEKMAENRKKLDKLSKSAVADITAGLTDDQKKTWKELVGEPFDTTQLTFGFGGGRPRPKD